MVLDFKVNIIGCRETTNFFIFIAINLEYIKIFIGKITQMIYLCKINVGI